MTYPARPQKNFNQYGVPIEIETELDTASLMPNGIMICFYCYKQSMGQFTTSGWAARDLCSQHAQQIAQTMYALGQQIRMSIRYTSYKVDAIENGIPVAYMVPPESGAQSVNSEETLEIWKEIHHTPNYENAAPINESSYDGGKALQFKPPKGLPVAKQKARSKTRNASLTGGVTDADGSITGQIVSGQDRVSLAQPPWTNRQPKKESGSITGQGQLTDGSNTANVSQQRQLTDWTGYLDRLKNPPQICQCGCEEEITTGDVRQKYINNAHRQRAFQARAKEKKKEKGQSFARKQDAINKRKDKKEERKDETRPSRKYFK